MHEGRTSFVYRIYDRQGDLLYVGCAYDVISRLGQHRYNVAPWYGDMASIKLKEFSDREYAERVENRAIWVLKPRFNKQKRSKNNQPRADKRLEIFMAKAMRESPWLFLSIEDVEGETPHDMADRAKRIWDAMSPQEQRDKINA